MSSIINQSFHSYNNCEHVFESDELTIVDGKCQYHDNANEKADILVVSKYMNFSYLKDAIKNNYFYFNSPLNWRDPFELLFYKPVQEIGKKQIIIHASCFACNDIENEEGFWNIWSNGETDKIVRVTYNVNRLMEALDKNSSYKYYIARVNYLSRKQILEIAKNVPSIKQDIDYLNLLCLKRLAYQYEKELRLFVKRTDRTKAQNRETRIKNVDYSTGIIAEITLPPSEPSCNADYKVEDIKAKQEESNSQVKQELKQMIKDGKLDCRVNQSALYCNDEENRTY